VALALPRHRRRADGLRRDEQLDARTGDYVFLPRAVPRSWIVTSEQVETLITWRERHNRSPVQRRGLLRCCTRAMDELDALYAFLVAAAVAGLLTPVAATVARRLGAVDQPRERGLADRPTPLLGGLAILAGVLAAGALFLPVDDQTRAILGAAAVIAAVGALDDALDLAPAVKLLGQFAAALIPVLAGVRVDVVTLPFLGHIDFGDAGGAVTLIGLIAVMNVVNFSDGIDGLAAGVCTISAAAFAVVAFDLQREAAGVLAAITAGAALGFLFWNFHPAAVFMGDSGSNLLGLLLGCIAVQGSLKTNALIALVGPLVILAVPFLDTGFVVAKRLKYRRPVYVGDSEHFHHRLARVGFSQRRAVLYLYGWTLALAGLALALRFVPYSDHHGHFHTGWTVVIVALGMLAVAASVYLVYVLEIVKFTRVRARQLRAQAPDTSEQEIVEAVEREFETGEFRAVAPEGDGVPPAPARRP
jgi:UDP-GlcNAc:undecaprenyl-phosphate GlcNAc-1-phosphate transferase